jgi:hypothetical protein
VAETWVGQMTLADELEEFIVGHRSHGTLTADTG